jgi:NTE family protein
MNGVSRADPRRAFVFGGGGVLGFAWTIGALTAVQHELGIEPGPRDLTVGTSAGAVTAALLGCGVEIDSIRRHQLGTPLPQDPPISWDYSHDSGGSLPPRPGWRPGSPRLVWGGIRNPTAVPPIVALSGLLPAGRGTLRPVQRMIAGAAGAAGAAGGAGAAGAAGGAAAGDAAAGGWPERRTWIVATDYHSGRRVVFGREGAPPAALADAVGASCAIPAWYAPIRIADRSYIDGGTASNASVDVLVGEDFDEVYVLAPMAALVPDTPHTPVAIVERRVRRTITRGILSDVARLRARGVRVVVLTPGAEDLAAMGANLMNPRRRLTVLRTSMRTTARELRERQRRGDTPAQAGAG